MTKLLSTFFVLCLGKVVIAAFVKETIFQDELLQYYNGEDDSVVQSGAIARCMQLGGFLAMPYYDSLNMVMSGLTNGAATWIAMGDWGAEGAYEWFDGERLVWENWANRQPDNAHGNEDCGQMTEDGYWNDDSCQDHFGYVCEFPSSVYRARMPSPSRLSFHAEPKTYKQAVDTCAGDNRRLVLLRNDLDTDELLKKTSQVQLTNFWVNTGEDGACSMVSINGISGDSCAQRKTFVCEAVVPHDMQLTDEIPTVQESSDLDIECSASGYPIPNVTWYRNHVPVRGQIKKEGYSKLALTDIKAGEAGLYECRAVNKIDGKENEATRYAVLKVLSGKE